MKKKPHKMKKVPFEQAEGQLLLFEVLGIGDFYVPCPKCKHNKVLLALDKSNLFCSSCATKIAFPINLKTPIIVGESSWSLT